MLGCSVVMEGGWESVYAGDRKAEGARHTQEERCIPKRNDVILKAAVIYSAQRIIFLGRMLVGYRLVLYCHYGMHITVQCALQI